MRWIVGDIHGMLIPLEALVDAVAEIDPSPQWIFVGDYVNRGPSSKEVIDFLITLAGARFCRGNHDDNFDVLVNGLAFVKELEKNRLGAFGFFIEHGLAETLSSYGVETPQMQEMLDNPTVEKLDAMVAAVPEAHRKFIRNLVPAIEEPDIFVAHARWDPNLPDENPGILERLDIDAEARQMVTWGRFAPMELDMPKRWRRYGFFGHTPVDLYQRRGTAPLTPVVGQSMVLLDTAAALSRIGRLTAFCPDNETYVQTDRLGRIVTPAQIE